MFLTLPADQTDTHQRSMAAVSPERVEGSSGSAVLNLLQKQRKKKGGSRSSLLMGASIRSGTRGWQLFKPAALSLEPGPAGRPAGQSLGFLVDHWSLVRYLTCPLVTPQPEQVEGYCDR